jgi:hypothetical protein
VRVLKIAVTAMSLAIFLAGVAVPAPAVTGVEGVAGALAPIGYLTGGHDPAPPTPPGCEPNSRPDLSTTTNPGAVPVRIHKDSLFCDFR